MVAEKKETRESASGGVAAATATNASVTNVGVTNGAWRVRLGWLLLPLIIIASAVCAVFAIRHIENQVIAAAPSMLRVAGVDTEGLSFDANYRDVIVVGVLPPGVSRQQVKQILEQNTGASGEDIRTANVIARAKVAPPLADDAAALDAARSQIEAINVTSGVSQSAGVGASPASEQQALVASSPKVEVLLRDGVVDLTGSNTGKVQIDLLAAAAATAVGPANVKQQWQSAQLTDANDAGRDASAKELQQLESLNKIVLSLGTEATAASITLQNEVIRGSIEARSEQSMEYLKTLVGDSIVVTSVVKGSALANQQSTVAERIALSFESGYNDAPNNAETPGTGLPAAEPVVATGTASGTEAGTATDTGTETETGTGTGTASGKATTDPVKREEKAFNQQAATGYKAPSSADAEVATGKPATETQLLSEEIAALQLEIDALQQEINEHVFFVHDSSAVTRQALPVLDRVAAAMEVYQRPAVVIDGHTDSVSSRVYNLRLSRQRAAAVLQYLVRRGIDPQRLRSAGYGEDKPVVSNKTKPGRRLNRRVEFTAREPFANGK